VVLRIRQTLRELILSDVYSVLENCRFLKFFPSVRIGFLLKEMINSVIFLKSVFHYANGIVPLVNTSQIRLVFYHNFFCLSFRLHGDESMRR
jgi:hypothetical protein